ncbi:hypothetical protein BH09MYX1_BH09MYX1_29470 [soil metagenome]
MDSSVGFALLALVSGAVGVTPPLLYRRSVRKRRATWDYTEKRHLPMGGAYRGAVVDVPQSPGVPLAVRVASLWSLFMLVPAVVSIPFLLMGFACAPAPSVTFGPVGIALAVLIVRAGHGLPAKDALAARFAGHVALASLVHNALVIGTVILASACTESGDLWEAWRVDRFGGIAMLYALVSIVHALVLRHGAKVHARPRDRTPLETDALPAVTELVPVYAASE